MRESSTGGEDQSHPGGRVDDGVIPELRPQGEEGAQVSFKGIPEIVSFK